MIVTQIATTLVLISFLAMIAVSFFMDGEAANATPEDWIKVKMRPIDYAMLGCAVVFFISIVASLVGLIWGL